MASDRETYEALKGCVDAGIEAVGSESLEGKSYRLLERSWDGRLDAAEESIRAAEGRGE